MYFPLGSWHHDVDGTVHDGKKARGSCDVAHHVLHVMETRAGYSILPQGKINQKLCEEQRKYLKEFLLKGV